MARESDEWIIGLSIAELGHTASKTMPKIGGILLTLGTLVYEAYEGQGPKVRGEALEDIERMARLITILNRKSAVRQGLDPDNLEADEGGEPQIG